MNFFSRENPDRWYQLAWLLCVITLPWIDKANNVSLIFLTCLWIMDGSIIKRWHLLKSDRWVWPFFLYFILLVVGMVYSPDIDKAIFTLEKKITFIVLPLIAITGRQLSPKFIGFLKLSFVYSCVFMILLNLGATAVYFFLGDLAFNFDPNSQAVFSSMHPEASPIWMHFSYIHLLQWSGLHPAYFSMYLVFGMVILFNEEYSSSTQRNIHILLGFIMSCFIALLSTRIAIIAFVACALYMGARFGGWFCAWASGMAQSRCKISSDRRACEDFLSRQSGNHKLQFRKLSLVGVARKLVYNSRQFFFRSGYRRGDICDE